MAFGTQLRLLLWKNFTLRKRQKFRVVAELVWPLVLFLVLALVKTRGLQEYIHECHFDGKAMPSAGPLPFLQGILCTTNNTCHAKATADEVPGQVQSFNTSLVSEFYGELQEFLSNKSDTKVIERLFTDLDTLMKLQSHAAQGNLSCSLKLGNLILNSTELQQLISQQNISLSPDALNTLLNSNLNYTQVFELLMESILPLTEGGVTPDGVRSMICGRRDLLLEYPNTEMLHNATSQICNLTQQDFLKLYNDFRQELDVNKIRQEIGICAQKYTGRKLAVDNATIVEIQRLYEDFQNLQSLEGVFERLNNTLGMIYQDALALNDSNNASLLMSQLFCGRSAGVFQVTPDSVNLFDQAEKEEGPRIIRSKPKDGNYHYDNGTTAFCNEWFSGLYNNTMTRILWKQIKPFIRGKILYTPNNTVTWKIIEKANSTFSSLARVKQLAIDWLQVSPNISHFLATDPRVDILRGILTTAAKTFPDNKEVVTFNRWLYNGPKKPGEYDWRDSINYTNMYMEEVKTYLDCFEFNKFEASPSEMDLVKEGLNYMKDDLLWAGVVFDIDENEVNTPSHIKYKIRMDTNKVDSTGRVMDRYWSPGPRRSPVTDMKYMTYGFAYLQDMIEHGIIKLQTDQKEVGIYVQQFPYPCYVKDVFTMAISRSMPMFMVLAWIYTVAMVVKGIVYEKEQRLKEVMKVMGLGNAVHWIAWFITCFSMMLISVLILLLVLKGGHILQHSDPSVLLFFMVAFTISTLMQCFLISVFFGKANLSAACGGIIYFCSYLPYTLFIRWEELMSQAQKASACLSSTVAFGFGCSYLARYEEQGVGAQWSNIATSPMADDHFSLLGCILMMFLDAVIYGLFMWYIEAVFPGEYGVPRQWYFMFTRSYWCGTTLNRDRLYATTDGEHTIEMDQDHTDRADFETEPSGQVGVSVRKLKKVYKNGKKVAVDGLSLNFYEGQITSFLGHNGAGKTTTMSILTGLFPPTDGTAVIYGKDIRTDMDDIRKSMGMCPQHNVLYDQLSVDEQIWFYGCLKGLTSQEIKEEMDKMVSDVGLKDKRKDLAKNLSGGMKRKLSVAIAFVAGSKVVILDEPTAGVDPYARRSIWELLLKYREGRTIVLSTHFMDEADILGDRIAIISAGKLCCCGSSLFLKDRYGSGYYLTLARADNAATADKTQLRNSPHLNINGKVDKDEGIADIDKTSSVSDSDQSSTPPESTTNGESALTEFIQKYIPDARLVEVVGSELCYQLPDDATHVAKFQELYTDLDENLTQLGIASYGISDTTLEEVFLKVADETGVDEEETDEEKKREKVDILTDGGAFARPVTRLSFRRKLPGFLGARQVDEDALVDNIEETDLEPETDDLSVPGGSRAGQNSSTGAGSYRITGTSLILRQFQALFIKRLHYVRRSKKGFISQVILPAAFICLAMIFAMIVPPLGQEPPLEVHPWHLAPQTDHNNLYMFYSNDNKDSAYSQGMEGLIQKSYGVGTRCMDSEVYNIKGFPCERDNVGGANWTSRTEITNETIDCSCDSGYQHCPSGAGGATPSMMKLATSDNLYNMTGRNITDWLVKTTEDYIKKRYGGVSFGETNRLERVNSSALHELLQTISRGGMSDREPLFSVGVDKQLPPLLEDLEVILETMETRRNAKVWFNNKGYISSVAYMNVMNNLILRSHLEGQEDPARYGITLVNHPMNRTKEQSFDQALKAGIIDVLIAISVIFAMSFIPASFVLFLIEERVSNSKHLQFVSGVNPAIYCVANFCWDLLNYMIPAVLCIFIFLAFQQEAYVSRTNAPCLVCLLLLYGWAVTPLMYPACYIFKVPSSAFVALSSLNVFIGFITTITTYTLELFQDDELNDINNILRQVFLVFPHYCLGRGLIDMTRQQLLAEALQSFGEVTWDPFEWDLVGRNLLAMAVQGAVFFFLCVCIEYRFWYKPRNLKPLDRGSDIEDDDVALEKERVSSGRAAEDLLRIEGLTKVYKTKRGKQTAVESMSLGVKAGECFGLLGVNGAGKTTTFKMLTGDTQVTSGTAYLAGKSILTDMVEVRQNLGYCPQFDAIVPLLTGREHVQLYARLRGVPEAQIPNVSDWAIRKLGLIKYADSLAGDYSGGNKRKLSTAIALVGDPPVVFLDEPTTGMDPKARRFLWNCIGQIKKSGRSVILTSHSMEECEALCSRIAIMVNGRFKCLGGIQHLKNKFGGGYTIIIRVAGHNPDLSPIKDFINETFPLCQVQEQHHNMVQYQLDDQSSLSNIFGCLEGVREQYHIEDYSVSQTTLDQVFINFAKQQRDILDEDSHENVRENLDMNNTGALLVDEAASMAGSQINLIQAEMGQATEKNKSPIEMSDC